MQKRLYVTVELPEEIKQALRKEESRWKNLRVFWTGFGSVHLTLDYLGVVDKDGLKQAKEAMESAVAATPGFVIRLDRIVLGPDQKEPTMFWATVREEGGLKEFRQRLRDALWDAGFELGVKDFMPHIVLAKANGNQLKGKHTNVPLKGKVPVEVIHLVASQSYAKGAARFNLVGEYELPKR